MYLAGRTSFGSLLITSDNVSDHQDMLATDSICGGDFSLKELDFERVVLSILILKDVKEQVE